MSKRAGNIILVSALLGLIALGGNAGAELKGTYLYSLSNFTGTVSTSSPRISIDPVNKEVYVITGDLIRVFNNNGMEIFSFGEDLNAGVLYDAAINEEGNIYVLSHSYERKGYIITLCNYRGEPIREIAITNVPPEFGAITPNRMIYRDKKLYFVSDSEMVVFVTDANGVFKDYTDLFSLMDIKPEKSSKQNEKPREVKRADHSISGFFVDHEGNMLFAAPITARAYVVYPDKKVESFGKRGSAPGRFAVPRGMARDRAGHYIVSDILRCVVMIFDKDFEFITEFGYRGWGPGSLIGPTQMVLDQDSKIYVTQLMERGISVFRLGEN